jgi:hypothetical protein
MADGSRPARSHPAQRARIAGFDELLIESDRFAEPFYLAMGAERIGASPSPVNGAPLPLLQREDRPVRLRILSPPSRVHRRVVLPDRAVLDSVQQADQRKEEQREEQEQREDHTAQNEREGD